MNRTRLRSDVSAGGCQTIGCPNGKTVLLEAVPEALIYKLLKRFSDEVASDTHGRTLHNNTPSSLSIKCGPLFVSLNQCLCDDAGICFPRLLFVSRIRRSYLPFGMFH